MTATPLATEVPVALMPSHQPTWEFATDVVIVGAGAAGLSAAAAARSRGLDVVVLTKGASRGSASVCAQGGLAAAIGEDDSPELHLSDTLTAGAGLCDRSTADDLVHAAPAVLDGLVRAGARFDRAADVTGQAPRSLDLGREGGHSRRRIAHTADATGRELVSRLNSQLPDGVRFENDTVLIDVLLGPAGNAAGVAAGRVDEFGGVSVGRILAKAVVLATGGAGHAWATTSNPSIATGDGLAAALRAGAVVRDLEFVQFHPTVLFDGNDAAGQQPLVTEALRGEGAVLVDANGDRVMLGRHPMVDLAPRDVVATEMARRMREAPGGVDDHLYLDTSPIDRYRLRTHFTELHRTCADYGLNPASDLIPVAPGAHYMCGGVAADLWGRTTVPGLFAIGEVAATGLHGANRLASNSLTEAVLTGQRCGTVLDTTPPLVTDPRPPMSGNGISAAARLGIAAAMSRGCGVLRTADGLDQVRAELAVARVAHAIRNDADAALHVDDIEATSLHTVATLVAAAASARTESRGCHQRDDHPHSSNAWLRRLEFTSIAHIATMRETAQVSG